MNLRAGTGDDAVLDISLHRSIGASPGEELVITMTKADLPVRIAGSATVGRGLKWSRGFPSARSRIGCMESASPGLTLFGLIAASHGKRLLFSRDVNNEAPR